MKETAKQVSSCRYMLHTGKLILGIWFFRFGFILMFNNPTRDEGRFEVFVYSVFLVLFDFQFVIDSFIKIIELRDIDD